MVSNTDNIKHNDLEREEDFPNYEPQEFPEYEPQLHQED